MLGAAAMVLLLIGATVGLALGNRDGSAASQVPTTDSVDAGFARDMIEHHGQGVLMAHFAEAQTDDDEISVMAYDINYTQTAQIGQMSGWLALWDLPEIVPGPRMTWMGHAHGGAAGVTGLMPGMATQEEIESLKSLRGKESDIRFLQLMIRHHQGGTAMMEYAATHAQNPVVRNFAGKMAASQANEVTVMTQMLELRGATPLPFTTGVQPTR